MESKKGTELEKTAEGPSEKIALAADFGTVYIRREQDGTILRPIKGKMTLTEKNGHIYSFQKGKYSVTAAGYVHLNKIAGVSIVTPRTIVMDGIEKSNPYVERNPKTKAIETVNVRKIGIGYNPAGNVVIIDKSLYFNIYTYLIQNIQAKMKKREWKKVQGGRDIKTEIPIFKNMAEVGTFEDRPAEAADAKWIFLVTADPLGLWINYRHDEVQAIMEEHTQRQRFGDRIAQTIVERNILKDHPAIGVSTVTAAGEEDRYGNIKDASANVSVYGYRSTMGPMQINEILAKAESGENQYISQSETITVEPEEETIARAEISIEDTAARIAPKDQEPDESGPDFQDEDPGPADAKNLFTKTKKG